MEKYLINPNQKIAKINKDLYGHFSEHLGRCIYEGIFVGENSKIPNVNGMRCDVVNALKDYKGGSYYEGNCSNNCLYVVDMSTQKTYKDKEPMDAALKAISVILFKLEEQIICRHPEYEMNERLLLSKINLNDFTIKTANSGIFVFQKAL